MLPGVKTVDATDGVAWTFWRRVWFRFAFLFWVLVGVSSGALALVLWFWPWMMRLANQAVSGVLRLLVYLVFVAGLGFPREVVRAGQSSDGMRDWLEMICLVGLALVGCVVLSVVSERRKRRTSYRELEAWLYVGLRFVLGCALLGYGFAKVFPLQMPPPSQETLATTYGNSSPFTLLWTMMGASPVYRVFAGLTEVVAGVLLLFRRTSVVGALMAAAVMLNVFMLNVGYDIGVKLYSMELLLMAVYLLLPSVRAMWMFFVVGGTVSLDVPAVRVERTSVRQLGYGLQALTIGYVLFATGYKPWEAWRGSQTALQGDWVVASAQGSFGELAWKTVDADSGWGTFVRVGPGPVPKKLWIRMLPREHAVQFVNRDDAFEIEGKPYAELHWSEESGGTLALTGEWHGAPGGLVLRRVPVPASELMSHTTEWVR